MTDYQFPLDADPVLRKHVKMEMERETAEIKLGEMKARFIRITWRTLLSFLISIAVWVIGRQDISLRSALISGAIISIITSFKQAREIILNWRDWMRARKELRSWDEVTTDYQNIIKEEEALKEQQSGPGLYL